MDVCTRSLNRIRSSVKHKTKTTIPSDIEHALANLETLLQHHFKDDVEDHKKNKHPLTSTLRGFAGSFLRDGLVVQTYATDRFVFASSVKYKKCLFSNGTDEDIKSAFSPEILNAIQKSVNKATEVIESESQWISLFLIKSNVVVTVLGEKCRIHSILVDNERCRKGIGGLAMGLLFQHLLTIHSSKSIQVENICLGEAEQTFCTQAALSNGLTQLLPSTLDCMCFVPQ